MRFLIVFLMPLILGACQTVASGPQVSSDAVTQIQIGRTDKVAVEGLLGKPTMRNVGNNGEEVWTYSGYQSQSDGAERSALGTAAFGAGAVVGGFIPIVGPLVAAGASVAAMDGAQGSYASKTLTITFRRNLVTACRLATMTTTVKTSVFSGAKQNTQGEDIPCAEVRIAAQ
jgi:hypothetical protein